ncbi:MAG: glycoside hydrolase family 9 protein [Chloroflexi bacterium]|nr:glycoside hydrolase family 9 protein [Chloroflexota bacterium]
MRQQFVVLLIVLALLSTGIVAAQDGETWLAPPEIEGEAVYIPFPVAITLDGDLSDWAEIQPITVDRGPYTSGDPANNGSFTFGTAADAENLYLYLTMPDQNIITGQHGTDYWNEDSLEFYLNLSGDRFTTTYIDQVFQINIKPLDIGNTDPAALTITGSSAAGGVPVIGFVFKTEDGWGFEAAVALADYGITPEHGLEIGFQVQANGATTQDRDSKLIWSLADTGDNSWQDPSVFGAGLFYEIGRDDVPLPTAPDTAPEPAPIVLAALLLAANQTGYFMTGPKYAVHVAAAEGEQTNWSLVNVDSGQSVLEGTTTPAVWDESSGDYVQQIDFSMWVGLGTYKLVIGTDESAPFVIGNDIYQTLAVDALRYFYLNRSGIELTEANAGQWARPAGHLSDAEVTCYKGVDAAGTEWPGCDYVLDGSGGWYDAGDYGKYVVNGGISLWTLLNLYERFPAAFPDGSLNIPESGNGVPDILDEARWEMEWILKMQLPASDPLAGMVFHKLHDQQWAGLPLMPPTDYDNDNEHLTSSGRYVFQPTTAATLNLAATAAQCARIWKEIDANFSARCLSAAETAWQAALQNPAILAGNTPGSGGGNYENNTVADEFLWAAAELYITTGNTAYADEVKNRAETAPLFGPQTGDAASMYWGDTAALGMISLAMLNNDETYRAQLISTADAYLAILAEEGYTLPMGIKGYVWGSNSGVLNNAIILAMAYDFTGDEVYLNGVIAALDYLLGRNALSTSFVSGYGEVAPQHVHHRFWGNQGQFPPPPPGALAGGPNAEPSDPDALNNANLNSGPAKRYVDLIGSYSTNEVAINWNAPLAWVVTYLDQQFRTP